MLSLILALSLFVPNTNPLPPQKQIDCLAYTIVYEAGNQPVNVQRIIADAVINRRESDKFPNTLCSVVLQKNQFSWTANQRWKHNMITNRIGGKQTMSQLNVAYAVAYTELLFGTTHDYMFFTDKSIRPRWTRNMQLTQKGDFYFYD